MPHSFPRYNIWHPNIGTLKLLRRVDNASTDLLWMRQSPQGKDWKQGWIQLHSEDPHQLVFEALLNRGTPGVIAVDNFVLKDGRCDNETYGTCDFESDTCGWQLHNWERVTSQRVSLPATDHSTRSPSGYFTLAKAPGGRMVSPLKWYDATKHRCLRFWFFISGTSSERLNVTSVVDEDQEKSLWYGTASQASIRQWFSASVNLPAQEKTPMVVFDAATSGNPGSAVAVDDISLGHIACPPPGSCSFDEDTCNWYNAGDLTNAQWYRHRGATISNLTGVQLDHTLGSKDGYYLLLDAEDTSARSLGSMQSEALTLGPAVCFRLYYVMRQNSGASLSVGFLDEHHYLDGRATTVKATTPSQWTLLQVERTELPPIFTIIITGRTEQGSSDIAIDDIDVRSGRCMTAEPDPEASMPSTTEADSPAASHVTEPMPSKQPAPAEVVTWQSKTTEAPATSEPLPAVVCKRGEFKCRTENTCIPGSLLCDGVYDCLDGLDEKCGSGAQCKENEFFCVTRTPSACLPRSLLCDGQEDCVGGSDEALCGACPAYFCQNAGTCRWTALSRSPRCECPRGYKGVRCQTTAEIKALENKLTAKASGSAGAVATGVIVVFAIVIIGVVAAIVIMRKRRIARKSPVYIDNPSYDASTDEIRLVN